MWLFDVFFPLFCKSDNYVEVRISQSTCNSESPLDFNIMRVSCICFFFFFENRLEIPCDSSLHSCSTLISYLQMALSGKLELDILCETSSMETFFCHMKCL